MNKKLKTILTYWSGSLLAAGTATGVAVSVTSCNGEVINLLSYGDEQKWLVSPVAPDDSNYLEKDLDGVEKQYITDVSANNAILRSDFIWIYKYAVNVTSGVGAVNKAEISFDISNFDFENNACDGSIYFNLDYNAEDYQTKNRVHQTLEYKMDFENFSIDLGTKDDTDAITLNLVKSDDFAVKIDKFITKATVTNGTTSEVSEVTAAIKSGTNIYVDNPKYTVEAELNGIKQDPKEYDFLIEDKGSLFELVSQGWSVTDNLFSGYLANIFLK